MAIADWSSLIEDSYLIFGNQGFIQVGKSGPRNCFTDLGVHSGV